MVVVATIFEPTSYTIVIGSSSETDRLLEHKTNTMECSSEEEITSVWIDTLSSFSH